jgi:polygalacturonase
MAVPQNIEELAHQVRTAIYGRDVRESIASSMEATADVADWSRSVAQAIIDGSFDEATLNTAIENKLTQLEQDYAPKLTSIETEVTNARGTETNLGNRLENVDAQLAQTITLITKTEGSTDDTELFQNAIDNASVGNGHIKCEKGKEYIVKSLSPKSNVLIDLNGSTLKLKDETELPLFYDWAETKNPKHTNFGVINGVIDANMQNNNEVNQSGGVFWLTDWNGLFFDRLIIKNAFRNIFNFFRCHNIDIPNAECIGNGMINPGNFYSYAMTFEPGCKNIKIGNLTVKDMYGFGIHFNNVDNYTAENLFFETLTHPTAIAVTFTEARNGVIKNIHCKGVIGDNIEINASKDLTIDNLFTDGARRPIIYGDNNTGLTNERVNINNVKTINTTGSASIAVNWLKKGTISNFEFDKGLETLANILSEDVRFIDGSFNVDLPSSAFYYDRFRFINTKFNNLLVQRLENTIFEIGNNGKRLVMNNEAVIEIPLANLARESGMIGGRLEVLSYMPGSGQGTFQEIGFVNFGDMLNITPINTVDGTVVRKVDITQNATTKRLILTNNTGQTLLVKWNLKGL